jgi:hypothetical protein
MLSVSVFQYLNPCLILEKTIKQQRELNRMTALFCSVTISRSVDCQQSNKNALLSTLRHNNAPLFQSVFTTDHMMVGSNWKG